MWAKKLLATGWGCLMLAKKQRIVILLFVLVMVLLASFWFSYIEQYQEEIDSGFSDKAKRNAFYAAELYLQKTAVDVYTAQEIADIDNFSTANTLLVSNALRSFNPKQGEQWIAWMERGGHIVVAVAEGVDNDPLLSHFQVTREKKYQSDVEEISETMVEEVAEQVEKQNAQQDGGSEEENDECSCEPLLTTLNFDGVEESLSIDFSHSAGLYHPYINGDDQEASEESVDYITPFYWGYDGDGNVQFLQFNVGKGMLSIVATDDIWTNHDIENYDHAYLLSILSNGSEQFVILRGAVMDHILILLWRFAPELVLSFFVLLLAGLWFLSDRLGAPIRLSNGQRRSFKEYALAHGEYLYKHGKQQQLIDKLRQQVIAIIEQHHFSEDKTPAERVENYLLNMGLDEAVINELLFAEVAKGEKEFLRLAIELQALIKKL
jgi:hypothetical protein